MTMIMLEIFGIWDIDYKSDNWEPEFMTILDSIRNSKNLPTYLHTHPPSYLLTNLPPLENTLKEAMVLIK